MSLITYIYNIQFSDIFSKIELHTKDDTAQLAPIRTMILSVRLNAIKHLQVTQTLQTDLFHKANYTKNIAYIFSTFLLHPMTNGHGFPKLTKIILAPPRWT